MMTARWTALARSRHATRVVVAALVVAAAGVVLLLPRWQTAEVRVAAALLTVARFPGVTVPPGSDIVYFGLTDGRRIGVEIAPQSAAALLSLPLLLVAAAIVWLRPADTRRAIRALLAALGGLVLANQVRVLAAALLADRYGPQLAATVFGAMTTALCLGLAVVAFVFVFTGIHRPARGERA